MHLTSLLSVIKILMWIGRDVARLFSLTYRSIYQRSIFVKVLWVIGYWDKNIKSAHLR